MANAIFPLVDSAPGLTRRIQSTAALAVWFSGPDCRVCLDLQPKLVAFLTQHFPLLETAGVDCQRIPAAAAQYQVFSVPTLLVFFAGRESLRKGRHMSLQQLTVELQRPYHLMFD